MRNIYFPCLCLGIFVLLAAGNPVFAKKIQSGNNLYNLAGYGPKRGGRCRQRCLHHQARC